MDAENTAVFVKRRLHIMDLVALLRGGNKILGAVFNPFDGAVELHRRPGDKHLFRVKHHDFGAKTAADEGGDDAHLVFREAKEGGHAVANKNGGLGGVPDGEPLRPAIPVGDDAPVFHSGGRAVVVIKAALQQQRGLLTHAGKVAAAALCLHDVGANVGLHVFVDLGSVGFEGGFEVGNGR